jgi:hypothetical protein
MGIRAIFYVAGRNFMENDMSKTHEYFQQELGLDKKTSEAIKILMDEGLLEPLLVDLRNALEAEESQNSTKPSGIKFDPGKEDLIKRGFSPEEAEEWLQIS